MSLRPPLIANPVRLLDSFLENVLTAEERTAQKIDDEGRRMIDQILRRVHAILARRNEELHSIAEALRHKATLTRPEIEELLASAVLS
jgi:ATP-dependent Zn protease